MRWVGLLAMMGCAEMPREEVATEAEPSVVQATSLREVLETPARSFEGLVGPLVVVSPETLDGWVFVADPESGDGAAMRQSGRWSAWPPAVGTVLNVRNAFYNGNPEEPTVWVSSEDNLRVQNSTIDLPTPERCGLDMPTFGLCTFREIYITSLVDPTGRAATNGGYSFIDRFGVLLPSYGSVGHGVGIYLPNLGVAPLEGVEWSPRTTYEDVPFQQASLSTLSGGGLPIGLPVEIEGTVAEIGESDSRWILVSDEEGFGAWINREGFDLGQVVVGQTLRWRGEHRVSPEGSSLRTWLAPEEAEREMELVLRPAEKAGAIRGDFIRWRVVELQPEVPLRTGEGVRLEERFLNLESLQVPAIVEGWVVSESPPMVAVTAWAED